MGVSIREAKPDEIEQLVPLLLQAEESESALWWSLNNLADAVYRMDDGETLVGAATVRWDSDPSEIIELAIAPERQGQGFGKQFIRWLVDEARRRKKRTLLVGTANSSISNIAFYQKAGFRMDHVRKDYFRYYREPHYENGIQVRDLLMFRYDLDGEDQATYRARPPRGAGRR